MFWKKKKIVAKSFGENVRKIEYLYKDKSNQCSLNMLIWFSKNLYENYKKRFRLVCLTDIHFSVLLEIWFDFHMFQMQQWYETNWSLLKLTIKPHSICKARHVKADMWTVVYCIIYNRIKNILLKKQT